MMIVQLAHVRECLKGTPVKEMDSVSLLFKSLLFKSAFFLFKLFSIFPKGRMRKEALLIST
jgi:hypothetical protein